MPLIYLEPKTHLLEPASLSYPRELSLLFPEQRQLEKRTTTSSSRDPSQLPPAAFQTKLKEVQGQFPARGQELAGQPGRLTLTIYLSRGGRDRGAGSQGHRITGQVPRYWEPGAHSRRRQLQGGDNQMHPGLCTWNWRPHVHCVPTRVQVSMLQQHPQNAEHACSLDLGFFLSSFLAVLGVEPRHQACWAVFSL